MPSKLVGWHGQHTSDEHRQSRAGRDAGSESSSRIKLTHLILAALPALVARVLSVPSYKLWRHSFSEQAEKLSLLHNKSLIIIKVSLFMPKFMSIIIFVESFFSSKIKRSVVLSSTELFKSTESSTELFKSNYHCKQILKSWSFERRRN